ncbi:MAG: hypothetical protein ACI4EQ_10150 [Lachnospiraceae bacterium]
MESIKNLLEIRRNHLLQLKDEKEKALTKAPQGSLRVCNQGNKVRYYKRSDPKDFNGVYIKRKDSEIAQKLAQKDYDKKVLCSVEKELYAIRKYFENCPEMCAEEIYENLHEGRQKLIQPICQTEEEYVREWLSVRFDGKGFDEMSPKMYTAKGERVRSKSEIIIADALNREGIPYRYEYPIRLKGYGKFYPDFTVLNVRKRKEIYWEHLGMMDDADYVNNALQKIKIYEENGIYTGEKLILTYETKKNPINQKIVCRMISRYLK